MTSPPSNPPGMPPPSSSRRSVYSDRSGYYGSSAETSTADEVRLLDILTREDGDIQLQELYHRSGLTSDRFRFWLRELEERGAIETTSRDGDVLVALKGKLSRKD
jgi:hypothetical protein